MVMVGRDIGTVVVPDAGLKVYLDATAGGAGTTPLSGGAPSGVAPRVSRRCSRETLQRDATDSGRHTAPLRPASDAVQIDTDGIPIDRIVAEIEALARTGRDAAGDPLWPS